jgi:hypothetical protein
MTKAVVTLSPDLMPMLGNKMYSNEPVVILARELVQNSIDACKRANTDPQINVSLVLEDDDNWWLSCRDNGDGMTAQQLVGDFLQIGGRASNNKDAATEVGGFGLAKVAIMRNPYWEVHSHDSFLNSNILYEEGEIKKVEYQDGTVVRIQLEDTSIGSYDLRRVMYMLDLSDLEGVNLKYDDGDVAHIMPVGLNGRKKSLLGSNNDVENKWTGYGVEKYEVNVGDKIISIGNVNVYRLKGLVQFFSHTYSERDTILIADIETDLSPHHDDYPFSTSREAVTSSTLNSEIRRWIQDCSDDAISTLRSVTKVDTGVPDRCLETGSLIVPPRAVVDFSQAGQYYEADFDLNQNTLSAVLNAMKRESKIKLPPAFPQLYLQEYEHKTGKQRIAHIRVLMAWSLIVGAAANEPCGIGLSGEQYTVACRLLASGVPYYVINPDKAFSLPVETAEGAFWVLWHTACHEFSHRQSSPHNEVFALAEAYNAHHSADLLLSVKKKCLTHLRYALKYIEREEQDAF